MSSSSIPYVNPHQLLANTMNAFWPDRERPEYDITQDARLLDEQNANSIVFGKTMPDLTDGTPDAPYLVPGKFALVKAALEEIRKRMSDPNSDKLIPAHHRDNPLQMMYEIMKSLETGELVVEIYYRSREKKHDDQELQLLTADSRKCLWSCDSLMCRETLKVMEASLRYGLSNKEIEILKEHDLLSKAPPG